MTDDELKQPQTSEDAVEAAEGVPTDGDKSDRSILVTDDLEAAIEDVQTQTDCFCWYWYSYGEKSYGFAVVSAVAKYLEDETRAPVNGSELRINEDREPVGVGTDGSDVTMVVMDQIAVIEAQDGRPICRFIATAYAALVSVPPVRSDVTADQPQSEELNQ